MESSGGSQNTYGAGLGEEADAEIVDVFQMGNRQRVHLKGNLASGLKMLDAAITEALN